MARKKTRKKAAAKAKKTAKTRTKNKSAVTKKRRKVVAKAVTRKKSKPVVKAKPARKKIAAPPPKGFVEKVQGAVTAVIDILTDAERLHHKLDPGVSLEPE